VRSIPGRVENLPPDCLMAFGSPITIRFYYHRSIMRPRWCRVKGPSWKDSGCEGGEQLLRVRHAAPRRGRAARR
jgi:hypothetical protein